MFHKILAAIDGSDTSHDVFKTALDIAKADRAIMSSIMRLALY
jgi:nucleotide-binding universal stress UspA family protein